MPRLPYVCRPIVLAVVLAVTVTAPHPHWRPTIYPRGIAVSTRPTTSDEAINAATTFVVRAMTPDCHIDHDPRDAWTRTTNDKALRDDLAAHDDMTSDDWWHETCHHDRWLSLAVTEASIRGRSHGRATVHVRFVTTTHRDDSTVTDPWHHDWTVSTDGITVVGLSTRYDSTTVNPWWQVPGVTAPVRTDGDRPTSADITAMRLCRDLIDARTCRGDVSPLIGDPDSLDMASRAPTSTAPVRMQQVIIDTDGVELRYAHGSGMWERLTFAVAPCATNHHRRCVTHYHSTDEHRP